MALIHQPGGKRWLRAANEIERKGAKATKEEKAHYEKLTGKKLGGKPSPR